MKATGGSESRRRYRADTNSEGPRYLLKKSIFKRNAGVVLRTARQQTQNFMDRCSLKAATSETKYKMGEHRKGFKKNIFLSW
jgi:hypothetical protein